MVKPEWIWLKRWPYPNGVNLDIPHLSITVALPNAPTLITDDFSNRLDACPIWVQLEDVIILFRCKLNLLAKRATKLGYFSVHCSFSFWTAQCQKKKKKQRQLTPMVQGKHHDENQWTKERGGEKKGYRIYFFGQTLVSNWGGWSSASTERFFFNEGDSRWGSQRERGGPRGGCMARRGLIHPHPPSTPPQLPPPQTTMM